MLRLIFYFVAVGVVATGLSWLADRPGLIVFNWEGYEGEISVFHAVVGLTFLLGLTILLWSLLRAIWNSPATVGDYFYRRRQKRGLDALSSGIIAIGAGDGANAMRHAVQARKTLPNEPLTHLLRAQAAQLAGDKTTTRRIFEAMLAQPDTEQLGLRGLFLEAQREGESEAARQFAERALRLNPKLGWAVDALFDLHCKSENWPAAMQTLALAKKHGLVDKSTADRRRAVLLTAQAQTAEESDPQRSLGLALEAHNLAPGLIPAAAIAGRLLASRGNTAKAAKVLQKTWLKSPHPDLAIAYAYARIGDSPKDRMDRVRHLASMQQNSMEGPIALARAAIEAKAFDEARTLLEPLLELRMTQRVATLMARIEAEEKGDAGRVREWLARAVNAARDPAWTADGVVAENWAPVSPVTGRLDAFEWRVPSETLDTLDGSLLADKLAELAALGAPLEAIEATPLAAAAAAAREPQPPAAAVQPPAPRTEASNGASAPTPTPTAQSPAAIAPTPSKTPEAAAATVVVAPAAVNAGVVATEDAQTSAAPAHVDAKKPTDGGSGASATGSSKSSVQSASASASDSGKPATIADRVPASEKLEPAKPAKPKPATPEPETKPVATASATSSQPKPAESPLGLPTAGEKPALKEPTQPAASEKPAKPSSAVAVVSTANQTTPDKSEPAVPPTGRSGPIEAPKQPARDAETTSAQPAKRAEPERYSSSSEAASSAKPEAKPEAKIFVSPRAPDDPGPETGDVEPVAKMPRYGTNR